MAEEDRYAVTSISGYFIGPEAHITYGNSGSRWDTEWYVIDTAYCCKVVETFRNYKGQKAEVRARARCEWLNAAERQWEALGA